MVKLYITDITSMIFLAIGTKQFFSEYFFGEHFLSNTLFNIFLSNHFFMQHIFCRMCSQSKMIFSKRTFLYRIFLGRKLFQFFFGAHFCCFVYETTVLIQTNKTLQTFFFQKFNCRKVLVDSFFIED